MADSYPRTSVRLERIPEANRGINTAREINPWPEKMSAVDTACSEIKPRLEKKSLPHISSTINLPPEMMPKIHTSSMLKPRLEKLSSTDLSSKPLPRPEKISTSGISSEIAPQLDNISMNRTRFRIDTPPEKISANRTDIEKAPSPEPAVVGAGAPGPPGGFLSEQMSLPRQIAFIFMMCMLQLIPQACLTTCLPISSIIASWFHITKPSVLPWMVSAYATTFGTFILISGRLGDIFGHKKLVVVGFVMMTPWSVVAGASHYISPVLFFVARAMQGIAASMMVPNGLALLGWTYPPGSKMKIIAFSLSGLCAPLGAYLGMLFGAIFVEYAAWWFNFYVLAGVSLICAILSRVVFIPPPPTPTQMKPFKAKVGDMDWLGAFTGVAGLICVQVALVSAPTAGWGTSWIFMLLIMGVLLVAAFVVVEIRIAEHPLVPFRLLKSDVAFVLAAVACGWAVFGIWSWYLWRYFLVVRHYTPVESAIHAFPIVPVAFLATILTAHLMRTTKPAWTLLYATVAATLSTLFLIFALPAQTYWSFTFISLLMMPIFMGLCAPAATYIMSNSFPMHMQGLSGSLVATVLNYSISLGLGLATTVEVYAYDNGTNQFAGIHGGWLMGVGIGCLGVLICATYLYKTVLSHRAAARPPTIRDLEIAAADAAADLPERPQPAHAVISRSTTLARKRPGLKRERSSITASLGLKRGRSNATERFGPRNKHSSIAASLGLARRNSNASQSSSLFPLTRNSSPSRESEDGMTALPDWRDRMMPQFEWRQVEVPRTLETTRYPRQIHMSQQVRYYQGRRTGMSSADLD